MPVYNAERWVARAIESVLAQTFERWELIAVDDGSSDQSTEVMRRFTDARIRVLEQPNHGCYHARNTGLAAARGEYVALLDTDDWYEPRHLERTTGFLDRHPECALVSTNYWFVKQTGDRELGMRPGEVLGHPGDGIISDFFALPRRNRCFPITCSAVFRRALLSRFGPFDPTLRVAGDHEFWVRWALRSPFGYIAEPLASYVVDTPGSVRKDLTTSIRMRLQLWRKLIGEEDPANPRFATYARYRSRCLFRLLAVAVASGHLDEARDIKLAWPRSPGHTWWWAGRLLAWQPRWMQRLIHRALGRLEFVRYRQGRPASAVQAATAETAETVTS